MKARISLKSTIIVNKLWLRKQSYLFPQILVPKLKNIVSFYVLYYYVGKFFAYDDLFKLVGRNIHLKNQSSAYFPNKQNTDKNT